MIKDGAVLGEKKRVEEYSQAISDNKIGNTMAFYVAYPLKNVHSFRFRP